MKEYVGSGVAFCSGSEGRFGGQCFALDGTESAVDITINDVTTLPMGGYWNFRARMADPSNPDGTITDGFFCNAVTGIPVPAGAEILTVVVDPYGGPSCSWTDGFGGTTGTITAHWT